MFDLKKGFAVATVLGVVAVSCVSVLADNTVAMKDMHEIDSNYVTVIDDEITDSYGNVYSGNVVEFYAHMNAYVSYDLNGAYDTFDATIVCSTEAYSGDEIDVGIFADGELIYSLKNYDRQQPPESLSLDVSGVGTLTIKTRIVEGEYDDIYFVNSYFTKSDKASIYPVRATMYDLTVIDSSDCEESNDLVVDLYGNLHNNRIKFKPYNANNDAYILYNLDSSYLTLTGTIIPSAEMDSYASGKIIIYLDDVEVYRLEGITKTTAATPFEINVSGGNVLKIVATKNGDGTCRILVADFLLKVHEHVLSDWTTVEEATCTTPGKMALICTECGEEIETEVIPAFGHTPDGVWVTIKEPTCTEDGEEVQYCAVCQEICETNTLPALGHTPDGVWVTLKESTCSEEGEEVQYCTVCQEVCETQAIETLPHTPADDWVIEKEPTCVEQGSQVILCTECGQVLEREYIDTIDHDYGEWKIISGNIWDNPIVRERECSMCGGIQRETINPTAWLKPLVVVVILIIALGISTIGITLKMNNLPLKPSSVKALFRKDSVTDEEIEKMINSTYDEPYEKYSADVDEMNENSDLSTELVGSQELVENTMDDNTEINEESSGSQVPGNSESDETSAFDSVDEESHDNADDVSSDENSDENV